MLKKLISFIFIFIFYDAILPKKLYASCNFKTGDLINELESPSSIENIDIKIPKSRKYIINQAKILFSSYKKKYN